LGKTNKKSSKNLASINKTGEPLYNGKTEEDVLKAFKEQMRAIRNYILFNETIPQRVDNSKDLIEKQKFIRTQLGLDNEEDAEKNLENGFKIMDALN